MIVTPIFGDVQLLAQRGRQHSITFDARLPSLARMRPPAYASGRRLKLDLLGHV